jgi:hypothetical protein
MGSNVKKMMVIIDEIKTIAQLALNVQSLGNDNSGQLWDIIGKCNSGLSIPIRNCDVGTEEWKRNKEPSPSLPREDGDSVNPECLGKDNGIIPQSESVGNAAEMLKALVKAKKAICHHAKYVCDSLSWENSNIQSNCADVLCAHRDLCEAKTAINAALSKPPRNCDVGTEQEQHKRFVTFCNAHIDCVDCPIKAYWTKALSCGILWGQMPYEAEEGGAS